MTLAGWETAVRVAGIIVLMSTWVTAAVGATHGTSRPQGKSVRLARRYRAHVVYVIGAIPYFAVCAALWRPFPGTPSAPVRVGLLVVGGVFGLAGAAFYLAGRRELGAMYNVSSSLGTELYADHVLITTGPYAHVRHPMYLGLVLAALGGLAVYRTWTLVFMCAALAGAAFKAHLEDRLLAAEFGSTWQRYAAAVPGWWPKRSPYTPKEVDRVKHTATI